MKFHWFHLMPYPGLPDNFREEHRSVWVDIDPGLFDPLLTHRTYNDYLDELEFAAASGFDGVCVNEHHQNGYGMMPSPNLMAASLARNTQDASIVVMGNSLALYNPPIRVAEEMAMIDMISGGRLIAGFPVGTPMDTTYCYGVDPATLRERYHEAHDLVIKAWTSDEPFAFNGNYTKLRYVNTLPRPVQNPRPPVWIPAGGGSVETWEWCGRMDYNYSYLTYFGYQDGQRTIDGFWRTMADMGKDRNPYRVGFIQFVGVADTDAEAHELYREPADYFYNRCLHVQSGFTDPPGYKSEATVRAGKRSQVERVSALAQQQGIKRAEYWTWDRMLEQGYVIIGSPTTVAEKLHEVATSLNVGHLMVLLQFGNMNKELTLLNTDLFARHVIPELHGLFDDEWEDHWSPKPLPPALRVSRDQSFIGSAQSVPVEVARV